MPTLTLFHDFGEQLAKSVHNFSTHTFKAVLVAAANAPNAATMTVLADITQIANGGGYTGGAGGGYLLDGVVLSQSSNVSKVVITDEVIVATGGAIATWRYIVVYNDSATSPADALVGYLDAGADISMADTDSETLDFNATTGVLTITV